MLEGRSWMDIAINKFGAKILEEPRQEEGYFYIYQVFTTCFVEFKNLNTLKECIKYLDNNDKYWNYDPYTILKSGKHNHFMELEKIKKNK